MSERYLFLGDSITCSDRLWDDTHSGLGNGFVYLFSEIMKSKGNTLLVTNKGFDGLSASALLERIRDGRILVSGYDVIILLIGINDVGIAQNTGASLKDQNFAAAYDSLLEILSRESKKLICLSPFLFPWPQEYITWMPVLQDMLSIINSVCTRYQIPYYSLQEYYEQLLSDHTVSSLTPDGIHLTQEGHHLLASFIVSHLKYDK